MFSVTELSQMLHPMRTEERQTPSGRRAVVFHQPVCVRLNPPSPLERSAVYQTILAICKADGKELIDQLIVVGCDGRQAMYRVNEET